MPTQVWQSLNLGISQLLIVGFALYWLLGQYKKEKRALHDELFIKYTISKEQVVDSLLYKRFVNPAIIDSANYAIKLKIDTLPSHSNNPIKKIIRINNSPHKSKRIHSVDLREKKLETIDSDSIKVTVSLTDEYLMRSMKLFVHSTRDRLDSNKANNFNFIAPIDTFLFKNVFYTHIKDEGYDFKIEWSDEDSMITKNAILIESKETLSDLPGVYVFSFSTHILKLIAPQILFVIFLIGLSVSAFVFTYRSFKQQLLLNQLRDNFISNITHELKTPVSTVKVALEAIRNYNKKDDHQLADDYLNLANKEMDRLDNLIEKVLNHSVLEGKENYKSFESINLNNLIATALKRMQLQLKSTNALVEFESENEVFISGDILYLEGILMNLIDNSIKYADKNPVIKISIEESNEKVHMLISDNGPGIPDEFKDKIFDKFFRISKGDEHNTKGYGLGLSFAQMVMKLHQGTIEVKNNKEEGCTFILNFAKA